MMSIEAIELRTTAPGEACGHAWRLYLTASALKSVPSWNLTPLRSCMVMVFPSEEEAQDVANHGSRRSLSSFASRFSTAPRPTRYHTAGAGDASQGAPSAGMPELYRIVRVPPYCGVPVAGGGSVGMGVGDAAGAGLAVVGGGALGV